MELEALLLMGQLVGEEGRKGTVPHWEKEPPPTWTEPRAVLNTCQDRPVTITLDSRCHLPALPNSYGIYVPRGRQGRHVCQPFAVTCWLLFN